MIRTVRLAPFPAESSHSAFPELPSHAVSGTVAAWREAVRVRRIGQCAAESRSV
jgi:hypothetical protein